ncbi:hypothetical protein [Sphingobium sp. WCS2017Hpa-17]|uniref:hypothetical protein n=1 Tax=Sphingobium sp. WCS2017Hpa-17 TaxID=3073638 RepID=UPI0028895043|nr:hypothetical protein [Sphingobium sp. WCS2017Hpa-17]
MAAIYEKNGTVPGKRPFRHFDNVAGMIRSAPLTAGCRSMGYNPVEPALEPMRAKRCVE